MSKVVSFQIIKVYKTSSPLNHHKTISKDRIFSDGSAYTWPFHDQNSVIQSLRSSSQLCQDCQILHLSSASDSILIQEIQERTNDRRVSIFIQSTEIARSTNPALLVNKPPFGATNTVMPIIIVSLYIWMLVVYFVFVLSFICWFSFLKQTVFSVVLNKHK
ncbi:hypothetical protein BDR26DRAFT_543406 [Obelidium mucronatum]|nr:hypothetical protein BDR26DRAFT_543406 [Obelidium mucronatum]